jgi:hypothetical protein
VAVAWGERGRRGVGTGWGELGWKGGCGVGLPRGVAVGRVVVVVERRGRGWSPCGGMWLVMASRVARGREGGGVRW